MPATTEGARMRAVRDIRLDFANRVETWLTTHLPAVWKTVERFPALHRRVNALLIDRAILQDPDAAEPVEHAGRLHLVGVADRPQL